MNYWGNDSSIKHRRSKRLDEFKCRAKKQVNHCRTTGGCNGKNLVAGGANFRYHYVSMIIEQDWPAEEDKPRPPAAQSPFAGRVAVAVYLVGWVVGAFLNNPFADLPGYLDYGLFLTVVLFAYLGFRNGLLQEVLALVVFLLSVIGGWHLRGTVGAFLPVMQALQPILGFYAGFFALGFLFRYVGRSLFPPEIPTLLHAMLGSVFGIGEAILMFAVLGWALQFLPEQPAAAKSKALPKIVEQLGAGIGESVVDPIIPESTSSPLALVPLAKQLKTNKIDPEKVDHEKLQRQLGPIARDPRLISLRDDPYIRMLVTEKRYAELLKTDAVRSLMHDPALQKQLVNIDWGQIAEAIRPGVVPKDGSPRYGFE